MPGIRPAASAVAGSAGSTGATGFAPDAELPHPLPPPRALEMIRPELRTEPAELDEQEGLAFRQEGHGLQALAADLEVAEQLVVDRLEADAARLEQRRQALEPGFGEEGPQPGLAHLAFAEVGVLVAVGTLRDRGVVDVQAPDAVDAELRVDLVDEGAHRLGRPDLEPRREQVAAVDAYAEPLARSAELDHLGELVEVAPEAEAPLEAPVGKTAWEFSMAIPSAWMIFRFVEGRQL